MDSACDTSHWYCVLSYHLCHFVELQCVVFILFLFIRDNSFIDVQKCGCGYCILIVAIPRRFIDLILWCFQLSYVRSLCFASIVRIQTLGCLLKVIDNSRASLPLVLQLFLHSVRFSVTGIG